MKGLLKYKLLFILFFLLFAACKGEKNIVDATYFGGKIVNPKSSQVLFYKGKKLLDSVNLSDKNEFMFKLDTINEGLYSFFHGNEYQFIFLEPNDSLLLRLNTWDFDESLVFSGKGSERNNLLINLFLINENEDKRFYSYYKLDDNQFNVVIDSLLEIKNNLFNRFLEEQNSVSPLYKKYVDALIELPLYRKKEAYAHLHKRALKTTEYPQVNDGFYAYRKKLDLNDPDLATFYVYRDYIRTHLKYLSYQKYADNKEKPIPLYFLHEVSQNINNEYLRNNLLDEAMWNLCTLSELSNEDLNEAKAVFYKHCNDEKLLDGINSILKAREALPKNSKLPELLIYNNAFNRIRINDVVKGTNAVIYFWPKKPQEVEYLSKRVKYLEKQYPNILFVGVNSKFPTKNWNGLLSKKQFNQKNQFLLDKKIKNDWLHFDFSRAIIVDRNGKVKNGFTHLNTRNFEEQLKHID